MIFLNKTIAPQSFKNKGVFDKTHDSVDFYVHIITCATLSAFLV
jgi:hypothetical protein